MTVNPMLSLESVKRAREELTPNERKHLGAILRELGTTAEATAQKSWRQRKGPIASYWLAVGVYARHTARAIE